MMKAQATLEFIGSFMFFALVVIGVLSLTIDEIPQFNSYAETAEKNLEVKGVTDLLLTSPGRHSDSGGGTDWENNVQDVVQPGFASEAMKVDREKIEALDKVGTTSYNYTSFRQDLELEHNYNFDFTWFPVVETHKNFIRSNPPFDPGIEEPNTDFYNRSDNRVHYGEIQLNGENVRVLVTAYDGTYDTIYITINDWDFQGKTPYGEGDDPAVLNSLNGDGFRIESIQNRKDRPGSSLVLRSDIGEFGRNSRTADGNVIKLNRYPLLDDVDSSTELMRMEVLVW